MPELPEVETTRRGIEPHVSGQRIERLLIRNRRLRWPVARDLSRRMAGQMIEAVERRAKYLLLRTSAGTLIVHLGMSGSLRLPRAGTTPGPHDHWDLQLASGRLLRYTDPRRFGSLHLTRRPEAHFLLKNLGPEPLDPNTDGRYLFQAGRDRRAPVKHFLMDGRIIAGLGNIYVCEALFEAGLHPFRAAGRISKARYERLAQAIKQVLQDAIEAGGTTLRDFLHSEGEPGYFSQQLAVYGRDGLPCPRCGTAVRRATRGQRGTWYCPRCQR